MTWGRVTAAKRILDLTEDKIDTLITANELQTTPTISYGVDRDLPDNDLIAVMSILGGEIVTTSMRTDPKAQEDSFTIEFLVVAFAPGDDGLDDAADRCETLANCVRTAVTSNSTLADDSTGFCVVSARATNADGPNSWHTDHGAAASMVLDVTITKRIEGAP